MKILVVVDMQNDFIDGPLGTEEARNIVPAVCKKIRAFNGRVIATQDTHQEDYLETQEGKNLPVVHCVKNTLGWKINDQVDNALDGHEITTVKKSSFGSVGMAEYMVDISHDYDIEEVVLLGLCTDICVISNAMLLKAFLPEIKVTVDAACCAGVTPESHENALRAMKMCQINIENWEE